MRLLSLAFYIDLLTGQQFLSDPKDISVFNLKVPRIAYSFTHSALIDESAVWAAGSARTTREIVCQVTNRELLGKLADAPECRLWGLSPVNRSRLDRWAFSLLAGHGLAASRSCIWPESTRRRPRS